MKTKNLLVLIVAIIALPLFINAQGNHINDVINKYRNNESLTSVSINPGAFNINPGNDAKAQKANEVLQKIEQILILSIDNDSKEYNKFIKEISEAIDKDGFKELITVKEKDEEVDIYMITNNEDKNYLSDFIVFSKQDNEASVIYMNGLFAVSEMMDMMDEFDINIKTEKDAEKYIEEEK